MPDPSYRSAPLVRETHTNADEVLAFLAEHPKGTRFEEGEFFTLPDIGQTYTIHAVRSFRRGQRTMLYLEMTATCAVEGCGNEFLFTKSLDEMRKQQYLMRTCEDHRRMWTTPMEDAWRTSAEIEVLAAAAETQRAEREQRTAVRFGRWEKNILAAAHSYSTLAPAIDEYRLVGMAAELEPENRTAGRDTRYQCARRALSGLIAKGVLKQTGQFHVDLANLPPE